jgi:hypothetical protein
LLCHPQFVLWVFALHHLIDVAAAKQEKTDNDNAEKLHKGSQR